MSSTFKLFSQDEVPPGFIYPTQLREFAESGRFPPIDPWWFFDADSKAGRLAYSVRRHDGRVMSRAVV
jgi:hypothetical protein